MELSLEYHALNWVLSADITDVVMSIIHVYKQRGDQYYHIIY